MAIKERVDIFTCEKCGKKYLNEKVADKCCAPYHCSVCGCETPKYILKCDSCRDKEQYEKAHKLTLKEYEEKFPDHMLYDGDRFFYDIDELIDHYTDNDAPIPDYVYGTQIEYGTLDTSEILAHIEEELDCEDISFDKDAYIEFENFAKQWNAKHRISCFHVDYGTVILIPSEEREVVNHG